MIPTDYGARCDAHIHEVVFMPRCRICDLLNREWRALGLTATPTEQEKRNANTGRTH